MQSLFSLVSNHIMRVLYFDFSRYAIAAGVMFGFLIVFRLWAENRRIQARRATRKDYAREILSSFRTVFFFGVTTLATLALAQAEIIRFELDAFPLWLALVQAAAMILVHDAYFYWTHRAMHSKLMFRRVHLHHHKSRTPTPFTAYSFSITEAMLEAAFAPLFLLAASLAGSPYTGLAILIFAWVQITRNVMQHAGVEIHPAGWVDSRWTDWISTTTHHDLHHSGGNHNFGFYFTWWDRWMGTEHPQYKEHFRAVAKPMWQGRAGQAEPAAPAR